MTPEPEPEPGPFAPASGDREDTGNDLESAGKPGSPGGGVRLRDPGRVAQPSFAWLPAAFTGR